MKTVLVALLSTLTLPAAWNFQTISGATEGAIASRTFGTTEKTYIAFRDQSGSLAVATLRGGIIVSQTVWPGMSPSNTSVSISATSSVIVTFWSADKFRYALLIGNGNGNCGPYSNWRCGDVPFPPGITAAKIDRVVGSVDSMFRAHFFYNLRTYASAINNPYNGLYYSALTATGFWAGPYKQDDNNASASPTAFEVGNGFLDPFFLTTIDTGIYEAQTGLGTLGNGMISQPSLNLSLTAAGQETHIDMDAKYQPIAGCQSSLQGHIQVLRRATTDAAFIALPIIIYDGYTQPYKATTGCSVRVGSNGIPSIAFTTTQKIVYISTAAQALTWTLPWTLEAVDASSTFSKPQLAINKAQKFYVLYQGPGYLKFAKQL